MHADADKSEARNQPPAPAVPGVVTEESKAKARQWFAHARKVADSRNYDYAIELYVNGLGLWPDAIDEGLKPLRVVGTARRLAGGKPSGFLAARKRPVGGKDLAKSLNNALYLFGLDPSSMTLMEQVLQLGSKANCIGVVRWIAPVLNETYNSGKKLSESHYSAASEAMHSAADLAMDLRQDDAAMDILQSAISVSQVWAYHHPESAPAQKARSNASSKLTIVKGRFATSDDFKDSLRDAETQHDLHEREKSAHSEDRLRELIARARRDWEENRNVPSKLIKLVDLMSQTQSDEAEEQAIEMLEKEYAAGGGDYIFKSKAQDVRIRQLNRQRRELITKLKTDPGNAELRKALAEHVARQVEAEIKIYEDRSQQYPSDMRLRHLLATRLFAARRYDDAIPLLQQAQADMRCRNESRLFLGRCFFEKKFHEQATGTLRKAVEDAETATTGPILMELNYWLARALEASDNLAEAKHVYGHLIQLDYNYLDARHRLEKLVAVGGQ